MTIPGSTPAFPSSMKAPRAASATTPAESRTPTPDSPPVAEAPAITAILKHFEFTHLPEHLAAVSKECHALAHLMATTLTSDPELTMGLRKLLEAKDCFVRAALSRKG